MGTTLAIRFPLGRYHANPWDRAVNEGETEWPPSPWRLLRALVATWHTRWPELPASVLDGLLGQLGDPPAYRTPRALPGHTRHYLPDLQHRKGETGRTDLTLDPFLAVPRNDELLVRWDAELPGEQRQVLAKVAELLPYLGRQSRHARLGSLTAIQRRTAPGGGLVRRTARRRVRLLAATRPVSRTALEASTVEIRRQRRTLPPGAMWVNYATGAPADEPRLAVRSDNPAPSVTAIRFAVTGSVPMKATHAVLLADEAHRQAGGILTRAGLPDGKRKEILGSNGASTDHGHAHWIPLADGPGKAQFVRHLIIWVPQGLRTEDVAAVITMSEMSGRRGGGRGAGYVIRGFPAVKLLFQAAGAVEQVVPELCRPARRWRSRTPYLPVRHRKRESLDEYLTADVRTELDYRPNTGPAAGGGQS